MGTRICTKCNLPKNVSEYAWYIRGVKKHSAKCVVRCANCHMRVEKQRRGTVYF